MLILPVSLDPKRIIEVNGLGHFYVLGSPSFIVCELPNADPSLWGWIIVENNDPTIQNRVYKLNDKMQPVAKLLIKNKEMAEEICFACNRLRV